MRITPGIRFTQFKNQLRPLYWVVGIIAAVFIALRLICGSAA